MSQVLAKRSCSSSPWSDFLKHSVLQYQIPRWEVPGPAGYIPGKGWEKPGVDNELLVLLQHSGDRPGGKVFFRGRLYISGGAQRKSGTK